MCPFSHFVKYLFQITSLHFYPGRQNVLISTGKGHVNVWTLTKKKDGNDGETELNKKQELKDNPMEAFLVTYHILLYKNGPSPSIGARIFTPSSCNYFLFIRLNHLQTSTK